MNGMDLLKRHTPTQVVEQLEAKIRELEFIIAKNPAKFDPVRETILIAGVRYSVCMFEAIGHPTLPVGTVLEILERKPIADGETVVTVRTITTEVDAARLLKQIRERQKRHAENLANIERLV